MNLISKVTGIYCIADDFCKEHELELNKKSTFAFKSLYQYGVWDGGRSRSEAAHTFLKHSCVKQKLDRKNRCVL